MNLIQIKQIDGLLETLSNLTSSINDLDEAATGAFNSYDSFYGQLYWDNDHIQFNSNGKTLGSDLNIAIDVSNGGIRVEEDSRFKSDLKVGGDFIINSSTGQMKYLTASGETKSFFGNVMNSYESVTTENHDTIESTNIVGVKSSSISAESFVTLPVPSAGTTITVKDEQFSASTNNINVIANDSESIEGHASVSITGDGGYYSCYSNGTNWFTINQSGCMLV